MSAGDFATRLVGRAAVDQTNRLLDAAPEFLESVPLGIYACDVEGRILWFNTRAAELWGRKPRTGDLSERYCGSYKLYFGDREITRDETAMATVLRTGTPVRGVEEKVLRPDGSSIWAGRTPGRQRRKWPRWSFHGDGGRL